MEFQFARQVFIGNSGQRASRIRLSSHCFAGLLVPVQKGVGNRQREWPRVACSGPSLARSLTQGPGRRIFAVRSNRGRRPRPARPYSDSCPAPAGSRTLPGPWSGPTPCPSLFYRTAVGPRAAAPLGAPPSPKKHLKFPGIPGASFQTATPRNRRRRWGDLAGYATNPHSCAFRQCYRIGIFSDCPGKLFAAGNHSCPPAGLASVNTVRFA